LFESNPIVRESWRMPIFHHPAESGGFSTACFSQSVQELALKQRQRRLGLVVEDLDSFTERVRNLAIGEKRYLPWKAHQIPIRARCCHALQCLPSNATRSGVWAQSALVLGLSPVAHTRLALRYLRTLQYLEYL